MITSVISEKPETNSKQLWRVHSYFLPSVAGGIHKIDFATSVSRVYFIKYILFKFTFNNWQTINTPRYFNQSGCVILVYMSPGYQIVCVWNAKLILCTETVNVTYKIDIKYISFGVKN